MRLSFSSLDEAQLAEAARRLAGVIAEALEPASSGADVRR